MKVDLTTSTCVIEDRRWPIVGLVCPDNPDNSEPRPYQRSLGGFVGFATPRLAALEPQVEVIIPMENSALAYVTYYVDRDDYSLDLYARTCRKEWEPRHAHLEHNFFWLPESVGVFCGHLSYLPGGTHGWVHAEGEWLNETLDRVSRMSVDAPEGPQVELVRFGDLENLPR